MRLVWSSQEVSRVILSGPLTPDVTTLADMPYSKRPHLMAVYAPEVDQAGHRSGPHSHPVDQTLLEMDSFVKGIFDSIDERNLTDIVDVIVVSDHGMAGECDWISVSVLLEEGKSG